MPYQYVDPEVVLEHNDVKIFHVYKHDDITDPRTFWFTTNPQGSDTDDEFQFDIRDLPNYTESENEDLNHYKAIMIEAIDKGYIDLYVEE